MKKIIIIILLIVNLSLYIPAIAKNKVLIFSGEVIAIDAGHGSLDIGTSYQNIYEKDINLNISLYLKQELEKYGATIIMTRENDYDLSTPNTNTRKKSDFDNRIKLINNANPLLFISIHQNYYKDPKYKGVQIFYKGNENLGIYMQKQLNADRNAKKISNDLYMYRQINNDGLLIECGFLSNETDRKNLTSKTYQQQLAKKIANNLAEYFKNN